jgi:hypothetical protein
MLQVVTGWKRHPSHPGLAAGHAHQHDAKAGTAKQFHLHLPAPPCIDKSSDMASHSTSAD